MKSIIEGERALCFWLSQQTEVSLYHPDEKIKQEALDYVSLMTPVVKSLFTDLAMEITNDAMQIHGGYGYTKDQGIEQLYRDNRITPIYEGTNSVQAADLVFRKLSNKNGDVINKFFTLILFEFSKMGINSNIYKYDEFQNFLMKNDLIILDIELNEVSLLDLHNKIDKLEKKYDVLGNFLLIKRKNKIFLKK